MIRNSRVYSSVSKVSKQVRISKVVVPKANSSSISQHNNAQDRQNVTTGIGKSPATLHQFCVLAFVFVDAKRYKENQVSTSIKNKGTFSWNLVLNSGLRKLRHSEHVDRRNGLST